MLAAWQPDQSETIDSLALALYVEDQGMGIAKQRQQSTDTRKEDGNIGGRSKWLYVIAAETNIQRAGGLVVPPCKIWYPKIE